MTHILEVLTHKMEGQPPKTICISINVYYGRYGIPLDSPTTSPFEGARFSRKMLLSIAQTNPSLKKWPIQGATTAVGTKQVVGTSQRMPWDFGFRSWCWCKTFVFSIQFSVRKQRTWSEDLLFSIWEVLSISNLNMLNIQRCIQVYEHWALLEEDWHGDSAIVRKLSNAMGSHEMKEGFSKLGSFADFQKLLSPGKTVKRRGKEGFWETVFFCANCGKPHPNSRTLWCSIWGFQLAEEKERP